MSLLPLLLNRNRSNRPTLNLEFTANPVPASVTFTRATSRTRINEAGTLVRVPFNMLTYSEQFDNAAWTKARCSVSANAVTAPDGASTADKLVEDSSTNTHFVEQTAATTSGTAYTFSVYVKAGGRSRLTISYYIGASFANVFDLSLGSVVSGTGTGTITALGNGWYRCASTATATATATGFFDYFLNNGTSTNYTGDGTSGIYIWGAHLNPGTVADDYYPTTTAANGAPAIDYDPVTLACRGLSIWEARTNLVIRSDDLTNAYWSNLINVSVTPGVADPDGGTTAFTLTATATSMVFGKPETATAGVVYTTSMWIRRRTGTGVVSLYAGDNTPIAITGSVTSTWQRLSVTGTATGSTTCRCYVALGTSGDAVDVCRMQLEAGSSASPYIPTTTAQVTRAADVAVISGANFTNFYNQSEGSFVVEYMLANPLATNNISVSNGTNNERIDIRLSASGTGIAFLLCSDGGVSQAAISSGVTVVANTTTKLAGGYKLNDMAVSVNGQAVVTDASATMPTPDRLLFGSADGGLFSLSGWIRSITYYPTRLPNATLVTLST